MEEPPILERVLASRGVSLPDAAALLRTYVASIDQGHPQPDDDRATPPRGEPATKPRSREEREEAALLAQLDRLARRQSRPAGQISDDLYERLKKVSDSIGAEAQALQDGDRGSSGHTAMGKAGRKEPAAQPPEGEEQHSCGDQQQRDRKREKKAKKEVKKEVKKEAKKEAKKKAKKRKRSGEETHRSGGGPDRKRTKESN